MIDGLWSVQFESQLGQAEGGVLVFRCGEIFGGDDGHFYSGRYAVDAGTVSGEVEIKSYTCIDATDFFVGNFDKRWLIFSGKVQRPTMKLTIRPSHSLGVEITAKCMKIADLEE